MGQGNAKASPPPPQSAGNNANRSQTQSTTSSVLRSVARVTRLGSTIIPSNNIEDSPNLESVKQLRIPTVLQYSATDPSITTVAVVGSFNNFKPLAMTRTGDEFFIILPLPKGQHTYRYKVDDEFCVDSNVRTISRGGITHNVLNVSDPSEKDPATQPTEVVWGRDVVTFEETKKFPPTMPPHMRYTPLNTSFQRTPGAEDPANYTPHSNTLPIPLSVTLGHVYFQQRGNVCVLLGCTTRLKSKYCSVRYYGPLTPHDPPASPPTAPQTSIAPPVVE
eukprot:PhF_6_TR23741/c1_g1_i1/m.33158/K07199/PRKAB; 5'-AMP-activated protein kinase, regulatory beta subunit